MLQIIETIVQCIANNTFFLLRRRLSSSAAVICGSEASQRAIVDPMVGALLLGFPPPSVPWLRPGDASVHLRRHGEGAARPQGRGAPVAFGSDTPMPRIVIGTVGGCKILPWGPPLSEPGISSSFMFLFCDLREPIGTVAVLDTGCWRLEGLADVTLDRGTRGM